MRTMEMDNKMNEFLQAIDEGRITHDEIIRRLENGIEAEYLKGKEANPKIIIVLEDMLYTMCTGNQPIPSNHPERYLTAVREEINRRRKPKANRLRWCFRVTAVTAAVFGFRKEAVTECRFEKSEDSAEDRRCLAHRSNPGTFRK